MKHKHILSLVFFYLLLSTLAVAQTRKIEAKTKTQKGTSFNVNVNAPELVFNVGHFFSAPSVSYSPDGKCLASSSYDDTIKFWNATTGELLATTLTLKDGEWLTYTPEGFFAGSEWATKNLVHIVDGMKTIGIDQMFDSLYRPDLIASKLRGEDISIHAKRVDIASILQTGSAPITAFLNLDEEPTDRDVTKEGLKSSFEKLATKVQADDVFIFYIAGHGVTYDEDGDYYYLPSNFRFTSLEAIKLQGISKNDLTRFLSFIKAGKTLILMDTCNSGVLLHSKS